MSSEISEIIKAKIRGFEGHAESADVGTVVEVGDGIARIYGLAGCMASELIDFGKDVFGLAFNLEEDTVSAIILGDYTGIKEGDECRTTGRIAEVPVGDALVGRVVDPLGDTGAQRCAFRRPVIKPGGEPQREAHPVADRDPCPRHHVHVQAPGLLGSASVDLDDGVGNRSLGTRHVEPVGQPDAR